MDVKAVLSTAYGNQKLEQTSNGFNLIIQLSINLARLLVTPKLILVKLLSKVLLLKFDILTLI